MQLTWLNYWFQRMKNCFFFVAFSSPGWFWVSFLIHSKSWILTQTWKSFHLCNHAYKVVKHQSVLQSGFFWHEIQKVGKKAWEQKFVHLFQQSYWNKLSKNIFGSSKSPWKKCLSLQWKSPQSLKSERHTSENWRSKLCWSQFYNIKEIIHGKSVPQSKHQQAAVTSNMFVEQHQILHQACGFWITILYLPINTSGKVIFGQEANWLHLQSKTFLCSPWWIPFWTTERYISMNMSKDMKHIRHSLRNFNDTTTVPSQWIV
jgi:hypothetical protein